MAQPAARPFPPAREQGEPVSGLDHKRLPPQRHGNRTLINLFFKATLRGADQRFACSSAFSEYVAFPRFILWDVMGCDWCLTGVSRCGARR